MTSNNWLDAQCSVIGSMLIDPRTVPIVMSATAEEHFSGSCLTLYKSIRKLFLAGIPVDPVSVSHDVGTGYEQTIIDLMEATPTAANVENYISLCRDRAVIWKLRDVAQDLLECQSREQAAPLVERANALMADRQGLKIVSMKDAYGDFMTRHTKDPDFINWPIPELNGELFLEPGDFVIIGGRPSAGKSAFALQCAWHFSKTMHVGFFSLETKASKLYDRMMASVAEIDLRRLKQNKLTQEDWDRYCSASTDVLSRKLELIPAAEFSVAQIRAATIMRKYDMVFVDYLQLISSTGENRTQEVSTISRALHGMAQKLGVTVIALSQLNRSDDEWKPPTMASLRESGQIEQDADVIIFLYKPSPKQADPSKHRILYAAKNKEGELFRMLLSFDGNRQIFSKASSLDSDLEHAGSVDKLAGYKAALCSGVTAQRARNDLVRAAVNSGKKVALCESCRKKMEESYVVTPDPHSAATNISCFLCGNKLFGRICTIRKPEQLDNLEFNSEGETLCASQLSAI